MRLPSNDKSKKTEPKNTKYNGISENIFIRFILDNAPDAFKLMTLRRLKDNAMVEKGRVSEDKKLKVQAHIDDIDEAIANLTNKFKEEVREKSDKYKV